MNEYLSGPDWSVPSPPEAPTPDGGDVDASGFDVDYKLVGGAVILLLLLALVAYSGDASGGAGASEGDVEEQTSPPSENGESAESDPWGDGQTYGGLIE